MLLIFMTHIFLISAQRLEVLPFALLGFVMLVLVFFVRFQMRLVLRI